MDSNKRVEQAHYEQAIAWSRKLNSLRGEPISSWASTFRDHMPCEVVGYTNGTFNFLCHLRFQDGKEWMARFPVDGKVMLGIADQKVQHEVAVMQLVLNNTKIPIPEVFAWGRAKDNALGLGPFIFMEYVKGKRLGRFLEVPPELPDGLYLRQDVTDQELSHVYRQIANFILDLAELDFPRIGSLSKEGDAYQVNHGPLTLKMNDIERYQGVKVYNAPPVPFESASEYFRHVLSQDFHHLNSQSNAVSSINDARRKYTLLRTYQDSMPNFIDAEHDKGPFKLICEGMRFGNMLVEEDLNITAVLDWEWAYAAPYQMLYSPPRWLIGRRPIDWNVKPPFLETCRPRYAECFQMFCTILEQEEARRLEAHKQIDSNHKPEALSALMRKSWEKGTMWFHEVILARAGFANETPNKQLAERIEKMTRDHGPGLTVSDVELHDFAERKMENLRRYETEREIHQQSNVDMEHLNMKDMIEKEYLQIFES